MAPPYYPTDEALLTRIRDVRSRLASAAIEARALFDEVDSITEILREPLPGRAAETPQELAEQIAWDRGAMTRGALHGAARSLEDAVDKWPGTIIQENPGKPTQRPLPSYRTLKTGPG